MLPVGSKNEEKSLFHLSLMRGGKKPQSHPADRAGVNTPTHLRVGGRGGGGGGNEDTYSRANERVTGERTGVHGSSHSGSGLISSGAGLPEARHTGPSVSAGGGGGTRTRTHTRMHAQVCIIHTDAYTYIHARDASELLTVEQKKFRLCL